MPRISRKRYFHHRRYDSGDFVEDAMGPEDEPTTFQNVPLGNTDYRGTEFDPDVDRALIGVHKLDEGEEGPEGGRVTRIQVIQELKDPLEREQVKAERREKAALTKEEELAERLRKNVERVKRAKGKTKEQVAYEKGAKTERQREARERMTREAKEREQRLGRELDKISREKQKVRRERKEWARKRKEAERKLEERKTKRREKIKAERSKKTHKKRKKGKK